MKSKLFLLCCSLLIINLIGCSNEETKVNENIKTVPNDQYVGNPHPVTKEKIKMTTKEKADFEKAKKELHKKLSDSK